METLLIIGLSSLYLTVCYFGLLCPLIKKRYCILFFLYYAFLFTVIEPFFGQGITVLLVIGGCLIVYFGSNRRLLSVILSLTGYLIGILVNHLFTIPLSLLGVSIAQIQGIYDIIFLLTATAVTGGLLYLLNRFFIAPRLSVMQECPPKLMKIFLLELLIGIALLIVNFIYGEITAYPSHVLTMNGILISLLSLSSVLLFYSLYEFLQRNQQIALQQKEQEVMAEYMEQMEQLYEEMRTFRHDYKNILLTMEDYIHSQNWEELNLFFHDKIVPTSNMLPGQDFVIGRLNLIHVPPVKSLLCNKLCICQKHEIPFTVEIPEPVENFYMDTVKLSAILGILLDNAIEAALDSTEPELELAILSEQKQVSIGIRNSTLPPEVPVSRLSERNYTTKKNHSGLGLNTVKKLLTPLENVQFTMKYQENTFFVNLQVWEGN